MIYMMNFEFGIYNIYVYLNKLFISIYYLIDCGRATNYLAD